MKNKYSNAEAISLYLFSYSRVQKHTDTQAENQDDKESTHMHRDARTLIA